MHAGGSDGKGSRHPESCEVSVLDSCTPLSVRNRWCLRVRVCACACARGREAAASCPQSLAVAPCSSAVRHKSPASSKTPHTVFIETQWKITQRFLFFHLFCFFSRCSVCTHDKDIYPSMHQSIHPSTSTCTQKIARC